MPVSDLPSLLSILMWFVVNNYLYCSQTHLLCPFNFEYIFCVQQYTENTNNQYIMLLIAVLIVVAWIILKYCL